jgi:Holliday junction resolvasome RuvABC endonuclease subunit
MSELRTFAVDCATTTGYAHNCGGGVRSGFRTFDVKRGESPGMRFLRFREWLQAELRAWQPELVVFERPERFKSGAADEVCLGLTTRVQEVAATLGIDHTPIGPSTLKKWATGNGNAKKPEMIAAARRRFNCAVQDDNEADALLILAWALAGRPDPAVRVAREKAAKDAARQREIALRTLALRRAAWEALLRDALRGKEFAAVRKVVQDRLGRAIASGLDDVPVVFTPGQQAKLVAAGLWPTKTGEGA